MYVKSIYKKKIRFSNIIFIRL